MIQLDSEYLSKLKILNDDLVDYIEIEDFWGDESEFLYLGFEDNGAIIEWNYDDIQKLLENTIDHNQCSSDDKKFLDHLISKVKNPSDEILTENKKIQFFIHIIKGKQNDSNVYFSKGSGEDEYMSKFKYFEDCFEESTQIMSLNYFDTLGQEALELIKTQILKIKKENLSFIIQLGTVSNQNTILLYEYIIPRIGQSDGSILKISGNFFINELIDKFEKDLNEVFIKDNSSFNFLKVNKIELLCEPNFSKIQEVNLIN